MSFQFEPRGDLNTPKNIGAPVVKTCVDLKMQNPKMPSGNNGGGVQMNKNGMVGPPPTSKIRTK